MCPGLIHFWSPILGKVTLVSHWSELPKFLHNDHPTNRKEFATVQHQRTPSTKVEKNKKSEKQNMITIYVHHARVRRSRPTLDYLQQLLNLFFSSQLFWWPIFRFLQHWVFITQLFNYPPFISPRKLNCKATKLRYRSWIMALRIHQLIVKSKPIVYDNGDDMKNQVHSQKTHSTRKSTRWSQNSSYKRKQTTAQQKQQQQTWHNVSDGMPQ